ncbi:hypothetical protein [Mycoplasma sp. SG1]|uniref:hypothetical protein n=1 Tax=Mycoplasma sp. SG1 TaxID=2810348 RepID=UPI00202439C1|nr:hypothetical protein [Mycoplasma sp. SG1]URM52933.1 hypothetical protein JRW51_01130 [Mycoplasma sp. SG1]
MKKFKKIFLSFGLATLSLSVFAGCGSNDSAVDYNKLLSDFTTWMNKTFTQQNKDNDKFKHPTAVKDILNSDPNTTKSGLDLGVLTIVEPNKPAPPKNFMYQKDNDDYKISGTYPLPNVSVNFSSKTTKDKDGNPIPDWVDFSFFVTVTFYKPIDYLKQNSIYLHFQWKGKDFENGKDPFSKISFLKDDNRFINQSIPDL